MKTYKKALFFSIIALASAPSAIRCMEGEGNDNNNNTTLSPYQTPQNLKQELTLTTKTFDESLFELSTAASHEAYTAKLAACTVDAAEQKQIKQNQFRSQSVAGASALAMVLHTIYNFNPTPLVTTVRGGSGKIMPLPVSLVQGALDVLKQSAGAIICGGTVLFWYEEIKHKGKLEHHVKLLTRQMHAQDEEVQRLRKALQQQEEIMHDAVVAEYNNLSKLHEKLLPIITTNTKTSCTDCLNTQNLIKTKVLVAIQKKMAGLKSIHDEVPLILNPKDTQPNPWNPKNMYKKIVALFHSHHEEQQQQQAK